jgi:LPS export ABC transporter protein LptC
MMRRLPYKALVAAAVLVLLLSAVVFRRYLPYRTDILVPHQPPAVVLAMEGAHLVGLGHSGKLWSVDADKVEMARDRSTTTITGITNGKIFDKGRVALKAKAGRAEYDVYGRNLRLSNGIEIIDAGGQKITGQGADWNSAGRVLRSNGQVSFETGRSKFITDRLIVDLNKEQAEMWNVRMELDIRDVLGADNGGNPE